MSNVRHERRTADLRGIEVTRVEIQMLRQGHEPQRAVAGGKKTIDVPDRQTRVRQRPRALSAWI